MLGRLGVTENIFVLCMWVGQKQYRTDEQQLYFPLSNYINCLQIMLTNSAHNSLRTNLAFWSIISDVSGETQTQLSIPLCLVCCRECTMISMHNKVSFHTQLVKLPKCCCHWHIHEPLGPAGAWISRSQVSLGNTAGHDQQLTSSVTSRYKKVEPSWCLVEIWRLHSWSGTSLAIQLVVNYQVRLLSSRAVWSTCSWLTSGDN
jgi:hypothetical protein